MTADTCAQVITRYSWLFCPTCCEDDATCEESRTGDWSVLTGLSQCPFLLFSCFIFYISIMNREWSGIWLERTVMSREYVVWWLQGWISPIHVWTIKFHKDSRFNAPLRNRNSLTIMHIFVIRDLLPRLTIHISWCPITHDSRVMIHDSWLLDHLVEHPTRSSLWITIHDLQFGQSRITNVFWTVRISTIGV